MHTGRIISRYDWLRCATHIDNIGVFRSTIWPNKLIVSRVFGSHDEIISKLDAERLLLAGGWTDQFKFETSKGVLAVIVDDKLIRIGINNADDIASFEIDSSFVRFKSDSFAFSLDHRRRSVRFSFVCDPVFIPCFIGSIHVICAIIYKHWLRSSFS